MSVLKTASVRHPVSTQHQLQNLTSIDPESNPNRPLIRPASAQNGSRVAESLEDRPYFERLLLFDLGRLGVRKKIGLTSMNDSITINILGLLIVEILTVVIMCIVIRVIALATD